MILDSAHERQIDMTTAKMYWRKLFKNYKPDRLMNLPIDRTASSNSIHTGQGFTVQIYFTKDIVQQLVNYASRLNVTLYQVCLTIYYIFLFKLTGGQRDLVIGIVQANRYRPELRRILGMFVNTLPIYVHIDPLDTFEELLNKISSILFETQPHSYLPYQHILEELPIKQSHHQNLIQTMFTLDEYQRKFIPLGDSSVLEYCSLHCLNDKTQQTEVLTNVAAMFDLTVSMEHTIDTHSLLTQITVSSDLFNSNTAINMAKRFQFIVEELFSPTSTMVSSIHQPICDLSLMLPDEMAQETRCLQWKSRENKCNEHISFAYEITEGSLSIEYFRLALQLVLLKHNIIESKSNDNHAELLLCVKSTFETESDMRTLVRNQLYNITNPDVFIDDLFYVHVFMQERDDKDILQVGDILIFNFHSCVLEVVSVNVFCADLRSAFKNGMIKKNFINNYIHIINVSIFFG